MNRGLSIIITALLLLNSIYSAFAQDILTAATFFTQVSEKYGNIGDYEAEITITRGETVMMGVLLYKNPHLLRIDFTEPTEQVLVADGEKLTIYIPKYEVTMQQIFKKRSETSLTLMKGMQGLHFLENNYAVRYLEGPDPVPLVEDSEEVVVKLTLEPRSTTEGFRQLVLSIGEDNLIRQIKAVTLGYDELTLDFLAIRLNQNIPEQRFVYDAPPYANVFNNFIYDYEAEE